ncbi:MAG TPA: hypothetical protein VFO63_21340, partial [Blastocatellia bacterium]|nr:hypothetical protein [Blastocatellia bacterium]
MPNCNTMSCFLKTAIMLFAFVFCLTTPATFAQTNAFSYQGRFTDNGSPASGRYDLQFRLFDAPDGGAQQGPTLTFAVVEVDNGAFTVTLNFGPGIFPGADRFLEIGIRPSGSSDPYTTLSPRQPITSTPYAVRSLEANRANGLLPSCVGCVTAAHIGSLPAGSPNYIQNSNTLQAASNFNISGNGTIGGTLSVNTLSADTLSATTQYNLNGNRVLSNAGFNNLFAGLSAGGANTGADNSFFGSLAGAANTSGGSNSFFGRSAGQL